MAATNKITKGVITPPNRSQEISLPSFLGIKQREHRGGKFATKEKLEKLTETQQPALQLYRFIYKLSYPLEIVSLLYLKLKGGGPLS